MIAAVKKYGNDIPDADLFAREVAYTYTKEVEKYKNPRGGQYQAGLYPVSANVPLGAQTGATPTVVLPSPRSQTVSVLYRAETCRVLPQPQTRLQSSTTVSPPTARSSIRSSILPHLQARKDCSSSFLSFAASSIRRVCICSSTS